VPADIYVNIQGDEPMIDPRAIDAVAGTIMKISDPDVMASNGYKPLHDPAEVINTNTVKVTMTKSGMALSYSRLPIPYPKDGSPQHFRQLGLYAFRRAGLAAFGACRAGPVERAEGVEMLRFLEHGYRVAMVLTPDDSAISVDTPADLERARELMAGLNQ
jgi:3-deoxy-manno-octulosonate cytidylyltransferase (CMP-KDO synthetase)